jgi:hypothetical protein
MERYNVHDEYMTPSEAGNVVLHADAQRALDAERRERRAVEQIAGQALGYPWFKDDQKNFPGATEADGVCIGEHVAGTIVQELASKLATLQAQADHTRIERNRLWGELADLQAQLADRDAMILQMGKQAARLAKDGIAAKAQLRQVEGERDRAEGALIRAGFRKDCDIAACNCGPQWGHGGHASQRLREIADALPYQNGGVLLERIESLVRENTTLRQLVAALPVVDVQEVSVWLSPDESGWLVSKRPAFPAGLYWAKFRTQDEADSFRALLAYRATLDAGKEDVSHD